MQVDAFTTGKPFTGNPAAVCFLDHERESEWLQSVAAEMNLSETAFVLPADDGYQLRWFTPASEVDLCGHATLAAAHSLWTQWNETNKEIRFHSRSGLLSAIRNESKIELNFPATPPSPCDVNEELIGALELPIMPTYCGKTIYDDFVVLSDEASLRDLRPNFRALGKIETRGVIVTAPSQDVNVDFVSRFFAPAYGVDEDPFTGSAHCALCPYWSERLDKQSLVGYQASKRGGVARVTLAESRVHLAGEAVSVWNGELVC